MELWNSPHNACLSASGVGVTQERNLQWVGMVKVVNVLRKTESSPVCNLELNKRTRITVHLSPPWAEITSTMAVCLVKDLKPNLCLWVTERLITEFILHWRVPYFLCSCWLQIPLLSIRSFVVFNRYRIPRENLLNRTGDVTPEGKYESPYRVSRTHVCMLWYIPPYILPILFKWDGC